MASADELKIVELDRQGRWQKMNQKVSKVVPGIDNAYLAMEMEVGVEAVWNEVICFPMRKGTPKKRKKQMKHILKGLIEMKHQNIVNFYDFWYDKVEMEDRLVLITEYVTSGSLLQFLKKTQPFRKTNSVNEKIWRRWCRQILSALSYLHKNNFIHGNLSLASILIQHNGLIKIGSVSPDTIHQHVKTRNIQTTTLHYKVPEYTELTIKTSADIYAFGICALELLDLNLMIRNEERLTHVHVCLESYPRAAENLDGSKKEFVKLCLHEDPGKRPTAHGLLKHPVLQEVFKLQYLCTFVLRDLIEEVQTYLDQRYRDDDQTVLAVVPKMGGKKIEMNASLVHKINTEKFCEEINQDFLLQETAQIPIYSPRMKGLGLAPVFSSSITDRNPRVLFNHEKQRVAKIQSVSAKNEKGKATLHLKLQFDKMERELECDLKKADSGGELALDLVTCGLLSEEDKEQVAKTINEELKLVTWS